MALFDWLFGGMSSNVRVEPDRIWLTDKDKSAGLLRAAESSLQEPGPPAAILLVCHFEDSLASFPAASAEEWLEKNCPEWAEKAE